MTAGIFHRFGCTKFVKAKPDELLHLIPRNFSATFPRYSGGKWSRTNVCTTTIWEAPCHNKNIYQNSRSTKWYVQHTKPISTDAALSKMNMFFFFPLREEDTSFPTIWNAQDRHCRCIWKQTSMLSANHKDWRLPPTIARCKVMAAFLL